MNGIPATFFYPEYDQSKRTVKFHPRIDLATNRVWVNYESGQRESVVSDDKYVLDVIGLIEKVVNPENIASIVVSITYVTLRTNKALAEHICSEVLEGLVNLRAERK